MPFAIEERGAAASCLPEQSGKGREHFSIDIGLLKEIEAINTIGRGKR
jgi:hypothetical protein